MPVRVFEFARFELDIAAYELRRSGRKVRLQRAPMDLLILLVERHGALVTREEIASRLWVDSQVDTQSGINTAVRKIRQTLGDDGEDPKYIETVVGKGYRFIGKVSTGTPAIETAAVIEAPATATEMPATSARSLSLSAGLAMLAAALTAGVVVMVVVALHGFTLSKSEPFVIVPFTALPGPQAWPAFSPDGRRVAFGWTGAADSCSHIYVKDVDSGSLLKLTDSPSPESSPSWSRDGRSIAFLRKETDAGFGLYVIRDSGGQETRIADARGTTNYRPAWSPDGSSIVIMDSENPERSPSLFRVSIDSGQKRRITQTKRTVTGDWCPAFSPDGRTLAYLHNTGSQQSSPLFLLPVDPSGIPTGEPQRIETHSMGFIDFDWSADGRSLIAATRSGIVRVSRWGGDPEPLPFPDGRQLSVAPRSNRMVYLQTSRDTDIFRVSGSGRSVEITRLISSTREDFAPKYSPDGRRIAFVSDRTGSEEIWVADSEGKESRQITNFGGYSVGSPRWSPDGNWIAFDSTLDGRVGIYVIGENGRGLRRVTPRSDSSVRPSWSRDGKWIYFGSAQSGEWQIWKTSLDGGPSIQVTQDGGREGFEDSGGQFLYYTKPSPVEGIWRIPLKTAGNGVAQRLSEAGVQGKWGLGHRNLYYVATPASVKVLDLLTMQQNTIALPGLNLGADATNSLGVSPDDRRLLLSVPLRSDVRLMLVRNFQ
jgi:Tol biopolymer transport system component/DNA-binding winged helix-turn-helix (wHTH) protein